MTKVIIFTNSTEGVSVCTPTGELPIETVLTKDCPTGAIIVDDSTLPTGSDANYFNAWKLNGTTVTVDIPTAQALATVNLNAIAKTEVNHRLTNTSIGIANQLADADWLELLTTARTAITTATTTAMLDAAIAPVQTAIKGNA